MSITVTGSGAIVGSDRAASGVNSDITQLNSATSLGGGAFSGMRNRIINGDCNIAQRGVSAIFSSSTTGYYGGPDRFLAYVPGGTGGQFTQSQSTMVANGQTKITVRQTVNTINTDFSGVKVWYGIVQNIEGVNCSDLVNKPISISFLFNTNTAGTYSVALRNGSSSHTYVTTFVAAANTPTRVVISVPANSSWVIPNSSGVGLQLQIGALNTGPYQTSTLNTFVAGYFNSASTATNWAGTVGNFIELTELQLEEGTVATAFERRSYGFEMSLCQRYYESTPDYIYASHGGSSASYVNWFYKTTKRVIPTMVGISGTMTEHLSTKDRFQCYIIGGYAFVSPGASASAEL